MRDRRERRQPSADYRVRYSFNEGEDLMKRSTGFRGCSFLRSTLSTAVLAAIAGLALSLSEAAATKNLTSATFASSTNEGPNTVLATVGDHPVTLREVD